MTIKEKSRRSFDYQCKKASRCRKERYQISCNCCSEKKSCEIQKAIEKARSKMY